MLRGMRLPLCLALAVAFLGCEASVVDEPETGAVDSPIWGDGVQTPAGLRVPVCVPVEDGCLRLSVLINTSDRVDETGLSGELVGPDCEPTIFPTERITSFHGVAFTGHGMLWVEGDAALSDGSQLELDVEAVQGDCF
jgi:hypothetical protein